MLNKVWNAKEVVFLEDVINSPYFSLLDGELLGKRKFQELLNWTNYFWVLQIANKCGLYKTEQTEYTDYLIVYLSQY